MRFLTSRAAERSSCEFPRRREVFHAGRVTIGYLDRIFYDGSCGLCHHTVRFALARDPDGRLFRFTPLQSDRFHRLVPADRRQTLPDSIVVLTEDDRLLTRSDAVLHLCRRIGGVWGAMSALGLVVPPPLRDAAYDFVARVRKRLFRQPDGACPLVPRELRDRFEE
jgi:predicted DCC family thiol-disulfide oxidoreductase YuxK